MRYTVLALLLLAAPLSAQQTVVVPDVVVPITVPVPEVTVNVPPSMSDSTRAVNLALNNELLRQLLERDGCNTCGGANGTTVAVSVLIPVLLWMAWELRGIKNKEHPAHPEPAPAPEPEEPEQYGESDGEG